MLHHGTKCLMILLHPPPLPVGGKIWPVLGTPIWASLPPPRGGGWASKICQPPKIQPAQHPPRGHYLGGDFGIGVRAIWSIWPRSDKNVRNFEFFDVFTSTPDFWISFSRFFVVGACFMIVKGHLKTLLVRLLLIRPNFAPGKGF